MKATLPASLMVFSVSVMVNGLADQGEFDSGANPAQENLTNIAFVKLGKLGNGDLGDVWEQRASGGPPSGRTYHTAVWTGSEMIIWSGSNDGTSGGLRRDGGRYNPAANSWTSINTKDAPFQRLLHTAVWTGSEMIVWGGYSGQGDGYNNDGGRYDPVANTWKPVSTLNAPAGREYHTAVWTGSEMIIWGGYLGHGLSSDVGGRYNPVSNSWSIVTTAGAPAPREFHSVVWTGTEMIVWGGYNDGERIPFNDGGRYNPRTDSWIVVSTNSAPVGRSGHSAVWTGTEMIVWGGHNQNVLIDGSRYDPLVDRWTAITTNDAPAYAQLGVWTGSEMIVWGGSLIGAGRYRPADNVWRSVSTNGAPDAVGGFTVVWTGSLMLVWGGNNFSETGTPHYLNDGGRYDPAEDNWTLMSNDPAPGGRIGHTAVWTGTEMIVWGGYNGTSYLNDGVRYNPVVNSWMPLAKSGSPAGRRNHTAIWTGSEMIIWGGYYLAVSNIFVPYFPYVYEVKTDVFSNNGASYNPAANDWISVTTTNAPSGRYLHTAVWTGKEMLVWGGGTLTPRNDGGRYNPLSDSWVALSTNGAPIDRWLHTAVWTGTEMIVWGGYNGTSYLNDGVRYNPESNGWKAVAAVGAPSARSSHTAVWLGTEMIVWGGYNWTNYLSDGGRFSPDIDRWTTTTTNGAPASRVGHTAVWTGSEMILWGGYRYAGSAQYLNDGARYNPSADSWAPTSTLGAPPARYLHTAVWTGSDTLIWGGQGVSSYLADNWSYIPSPPCLSIMPAGSHSILLAWPYPFVGFALEHSTALGKTNWTRVSGASARIGSQWQLTVPTSLDKQFYRLHKP